MKRRSFAYRKIPSVGLLFAFSVGIGQGDHRCRTKDWGTQLEDRRWRKRSEGAEIERKTQHHSARCSSPNLHENTSRHDHTTSHTSDQSEQWRHVTETKGDVLFHRSSISVAAILGITFACIPFPQAVSSSQSIYPLPSLSHPPILLTPTPTLGLRLLLDIRLRAPLLRLRIVMLDPHLLLLLAIPRDPRHHPAGGALHAVLHARAEVRELALRFLPLALGVLLRAFFLEGFGTDEPAEGFFGRAEGLVPGSCRGRRLVAGFGVGGSVGGRR